MGAKKLKLRGDVAAALKTGKHVETVPVRKRGRPPKIHGDRADITIRLGTEDDITIMLGQATALSQKDDPAITSVDVARDCLREGLRRRLGRAS